MYFTADPFTRVVFLNHSQATERLQNTICPTWDQTLVFDTVHIHGDPQKVVDNPPKIIIEIFDYDSFVSRHSSTITMYKFSIHCVSKNRAPFLFLRLFCVLFTDLKNIWQNCSKENLQQNTHFKIYIDAWYLICNPGRKHVQKNSTATVDIFITQQNPKLKLATQFKMNAKHSKRRSEQVFKMSSTSFHTSS